MLLQLSRKSVAATGVGMHIPDGLINAPTAVATFAVSGGTLAYAVRRTRDALDDRTIPLIGLTAAFIFAVQMVNFPIPLGTSGHLQGGALAAILLGPWLGAIVTATVLLVQALFFADGGITALGANWSLMSVVGAVGGYYLFRAVASVLPRTKGAFLGAAGFTAWATLIVASAVCATYLVLNGLTPATYGALVGLHALIGLGEAAITVAVVAAVVETRPDLIATADLLPGTQRMRSRGRVGGFVLVGLGVTLVVAMGVSYLASAAPDGLESGVLRSECADAADADACLESAAGDSVFAGSPLPDYEGGWVSGLIGVTATFAIGSGIVLIGRAGTRGTGPAAQPG